MSTPASNRKDALLAQAKHEQIGLPAQLYRPLDAAAVGRIAEAALHILQTSGMAVHSRTAREAFRAAGATVDEDRKVVRLPRSLVEDAIASNPSSVTLYSRDGEYDCVLEDSKVHYGTGGTAIYVLDPDSGQRRPSKIIDVILNARMVQALQNIHLFTINVFPKDVR